MITTIRDTKGREFQAHVFDTRAEAKAYAAANPVRMRNASGAHLSQPAAIHAVKGGKFAVI